MSVRQLAKGVVEKLLRAVPRSPRHMQGRALILAYHNVVPDGSEGLGDRSLHLPFRAFLRQLELLQRYCRLLPLADVLGGARWDRGPVVALTFDDAYRGAVELALPALAQRRLPSTMFVAPGLLGRKGFWWDLLADGSGGLTAGVRTQMLEVGAGRPTPSSGANLPGAYGCATANQLLAHGTLGPVTWGAHSWSHPNLTRISPGDLTSELERPLEWLRDSGLPTLPILAYPFGLSSPAVETAAAEAGYTAALRIDGGWLDQGGEPNRVPRYNIPAGLSNDGLLLRLSGVLSLAPSGSGGG